MTLHPSGRARSCFAEFPSWRHSWDGDSAAQGLPVLHIGALKPGMKTSRIEKAYSGILAEPIPKWTALTQPTEEKIAKIIDKKWKALFVHYGIDLSAAFEPGRPEMASAWANLAWHLARDHVPGFRGAPRTRGKPAIRKPDDVTLFMHVEFLRRRDGLSDRKAIQKIAGQNLVSGTESALLQRYKRAKPQFGPIFAMFDNLAAAIGQEGFVRVLEDALYGDKKETILSLD
jgi:hypothetical protein